MKISNLFITILCFAQIICSAQEEETDRKGRFLFSIGPEYRIAPFYEYQALTVNDANFSSYTNIDKQNSGLAVELGVEYFVTKKLSVGFSNSFRYNLVVSEFDEITGASGIKEADYKLLMDYSLYLAYYFKIFNKGDFFVSAGISLMNRNSEFSVKTTDYNDDGTVLSENFTILNYNYSANKITIGYKKGIGKIYAGIYTTIQAPYFDVTKRFSVPFIGCSFDIGKL